MSLSDRRSGRNACIWRRKENRGRGKLGLSPLFGTYNGLGYIRTVSVCVAILLVPHLTFEYFMQTIRRCSYFFCRLREKRFRIRGTYRGKVPYNSAMLYIDCRSQSLYVLLSKQTYVRNKFPRFSIRKTCTIQFLLRIIIFLVSILTSITNSQTLLLIE